MNALNQLAALDTSIAAAQQRGNQGTGLEILLLIMGGLLTLGLLAFFIIVLSRKGGSE